MEKIASELISREEFSELLKLSHKNFNFLVSFFMRIIKLDKINVLYKQNTLAVSENFAQALLDKLNIKYDVSEEELKNIPEKGAFITVSNHPYGGLDGLILLSLLQKKRFDFKIVANYLLSKIPELADCFISVDPFKNKFNKEVNFSGVKKIFTHLNNEGAIGLFPAGEVSAFRTDSLKIEDKLWSSSAGKIILKSGSPVIPIYFSGANSIMFNFLGILHPSLRTLRLPTELLNKKDKHIKIRIGNAIKPERLREFEDTAQLMRYLRAKTYSLGSSLEANHFFNIKMLNEKETVAEPVRPAAIKSELKLIKEKDLLFNASNYEVYISEAESIPCILKEIGRLREITFRENGEGTNRSVDLDEFDLHYRHLFIWDTAAEKIAGSYRIGIGSEIYKKYKRKGFYLNTLFKMKKDFKEILKSSLEMGRSFVTKEYQKKHIILFLLWKGVLCFLKNGNSHVKFLIGPVSISNDFSSYSKEILIKFIKKYHYCEETAKFIKPRKKFRLNSNEENTDILLDAEGKDFKLIDKLISEIEISNNKMPVLLKKYLSQNAKIIGFNIDPKFNNSLDGFLVMNLENLPEETIPMLEK